MGTLNLQDVVKHGAGRVHRVVKVKRVAVSAATSIGNRTEPGRGKDDRFSSPETPDTAKKVCREKITWP